MKSIYLAGGRPKNTAINILKQHLEDKGHRVTRDPKDSDGWDCTLRWGVSYHGNKPALNAHVNEFDKLQAFEQFAIADVRYPEAVYRDVANRACGNHPRKFLDLPKFPWLARKRHHVKGKDIVVCKTPKDVLKVLLSHENHAFFSVFIPTETEFRVWVFQDKAFGIYEKQFKGEGEYEGFMRNRRFGFKFQKRDDLRGNKEIEQPCIKAVAALGMDFGAVDMLLGKNGRYYVLEVNSMPHIDSPKRSTGIRLAHYVSKWAEEL